MVSSEVMVWRGSCVGFGVLLSTRQHLEIVPVLGEAVVKGGMLIFDRLER